MDRSSVITLIKKTYTTDAIGQQVAIETSRTVFCDLRSVTRNEWATAGQLGLNPELVAVMFAPDYQGEEIVEITEGRSAVRYGVYRTYLDRNEALELYLEKKAGVTNG